MHSVKHPDITPWRTRRVNDIAPVITLGITHIEQILQYHPLLIEQHTSHLDTQRRQRAVVLTKAFKHLKCRWVHALITRTQKRQRQARLQGVGHRSCSLLCQVKGSHGIDVTHAQIQLGNHRCNELRRKVWPLDNLHNDLSLLPLIASREHPLAKAQLPAAGLYMAIEVY